MRWLSLVALEPCKHIEVLWWRKLKSVLHLREERHRLLRWHLWLVDFCPHFQRFCELCRCFELLLVYLIEVTLRLIHCKHHAIVLFLFYSRFWHELLLFLSFVFRSLGRVCSCWLGVPRRGYFVFGVSGAIPRSQHIFTLLISLFLLFDSLTLLLFVDHLQCDSLLLFSPCRARGFQSWPWLWDRLLDLRGIGVLLASDDGKIKFLHSEKACGFLCCH